MMKWQQAIKESKKGTATRVEIKNGKRYTTIKYDDGSGILLVGDLSTDTFINAREATHSELIGFDDWMPDRKD